MALERESGVKCEADIITWRGMMTKVCERCLPVIARRAKVLMFYAQIMATPFDNMNGYEFFLCVVKRSMLTCPSFEMNATSFQVGDPSRRDDTPCS